MTKSTEGLASHTDSNPSDIDIARNRIRTVLERRTEPMTAKMLGRQVPVSQSTVRDIIQQLIDDAMPVVNKSPGYKLIETKEELDREIQRIDDIIETKEETKARLARAFNQREYSDD